MNFCADRCRRRKQQNPQRMSEDGNVLTDSLKASDCGHKNGFVVPPRKHGKENNALKKFHGNLTDKFSVNCDVNAAVENPQIKTSNQCVTCDLSVTERLGLERAVITEVQKNLSGGVDENDNFEKMTAAPELEVSPADDVTVPDKSGLNVTEKSANVIQNVVQCDSNEETAQLSSDADPSTQGQEAPEGSLSTTELPPVGQNLDGESLVEYISRSSASVIPPESFDDDAASSEQDSLLSSIDDVTLRCAHCPLTFTKVTILQDHMHEVHPDFPIQFLCSKCDEMFTNRSSLDKHLALHSPNCQTCKMCLKTFANVYRLQRHMISHDESTELRKFKCPECSKAFKFKHHLKEHIRIHSGEKPFECNNCAKRFSHSGSYSSHMTSKKCWNINGKTRERNSGKVDSSSPYRTPPRPVIELTQAVSQTGSVYPGHLVHVDPRSMPGIPAYYSPTTSSHATFIPYSLYSNKQVNFPTKHGILAATALYNSKVIHTNQVPDVNSNMSAPKEGSAVKNEDGDVSPIAAVDGINGVKKEFVNACKYCEERFENPVALHQHVMYECAKSPKDEKPSMKKTCKFCQEAFDSPVELHQHERYLCKKNADIVPKPVNGETCHSPTNSTASSDLAQHGAMNESDDEPELKEESDKKLRMRSLINDEQQRILRAFYEQNPRPRKYELIQIGNRVGFSKRVVQVWFQNMRARDRKRGRSVPYFPSMARYKRPEIPSNSVAPAKYIAVVPQPYSGYSSRIRGLYEAENANTTPLNLTMSATSKPLQDAPLDLSMKRSPPRAHRGSVIASLPSSNTEALNLSRKDSKSDQNEAVRSFATAATAADASFRNSAIFKYMQREGIFMQNSLYPIQTSTPKFAHSPNSAFQQCRDGYMKSSHRDSSSKDDHPAIDGSRTDGSAPDDSDADEVDDGQTDSGHYSIASCGMEEDHTDKCNKLSKQPQLVESEQTGDEARTYSPTSGNASPMSNKKKRKSWKSHRIDVDEGMYACDQCDKLFSKQSSLARHKYEHSGARPFSCTICYKAFKHKHHLTEHNRLHSGEKPFECKKCGKRFSHSGSFSQHMNHRYKYCKPSLDGSIEDYESPLDEHHEGGHDDKNDLNSKRNASDSDDDYGRLEGNSMADIYNFINAKSNTNITADADDSDDNNAEIRRRLDAIYSLTNLRNGGKRKSPFDGFNNAYGSPAKKTPEEDMQNHEKRTGDDGVVQEKEYEITTSQKIIDAIRNFSKTRKTDTEYSGKFPLNSVENSEDSSDSCAESPRDEKRLDIHLQCLNLIRK